MKVALREIVGDHVLRQGEQWGIDRPALPDIFTPPSDDSEDLLAAAGINVEADEEE